MAAEAVISEKLFELLSRTENEPLLRSMEELEILKESVQTAKNVMRALEEGQGDLIRSSMGDLVAQIYQADDLVDEILTSVKSRNLHSRISQEVRLFFSSRNQIVFQLRKARQVSRTSQQIQELAMPTLDEFSSIEPPQSQFEPSQPFKLAENEVIGRDRDRDNIIRMLLQSRTLIKSNVSVMPIVGLPGVGKSTLAKYVYNNEKVKNHFDLRMWIRVSQITDEAEIIREIVESCSSRRSNDNRNSRQANFLHSSSRGPFCNLLRCQTFGASATHPASLSSTGRLQYYRKETDIYERRLQKEIEGKLYLLILDDASIISWQHLKNLLGRGAKGSQILMTTRSDRVADLSRTEGFEAYPLEGLENQDSWYLFKTFAFGQEDPREGELKDIGYSIAKNCKGVPLTIKVAASLLYRKRNDYWSFFNDNLMLSMEQEENTMKHVLRLSYTHLPIHLKACFGYCSLFPDDFNFNKQDLISLWIAQGFIDDYQDGPSLEEKAEKYFLELTRRCFFEDVTTDYLGNIVTCKMHHIMHKLARQNATGVMNMYEADFNPVLDSACKHISFTCPKDLSIKIAPSLLQAQGLRTLLAVKDPESCMKQYTVICNILITKFKCLRVLDLHDLGIEGLPVSIGGLVHLRYLDLSKNEGLAVLPHSITKLHNLQTLKLNSCSKLGRLPINFQDLVNLKRLEIDECDSLTCMPMGIEKLTQLETLSRLVVSKDCSKDMASIGLKALEKLQGLRGRLSIELTGDWAANIHEAQQAKLWNKPNLSELRISWSKTMSEKSLYQQLLEGLNTSAELKILCIEGYKGEDFPSWAQRDILCCLPNLVVVSIEGCDKCEHLPPFGELPSLRRLTLRHMANVKYVERETSSESPSGSSQELTTTPSRFFGSLEELTLHNFYKLEGWRKEVAVMSGKDEEIRLFPSLTKLRIWNCPNLRSMPLFMHVLELDLRNVNQILLEECEKKASMARKHQLQGSFRIKHLHIKRCHNLKSFKPFRKGLGGLPKLKQLVVESCDALCSLSSELKYLDSLERLEISSCRELNLSDDGINAADDRSRISWITSTIANHLSGMSRSPWASMILLSHLTLREIPKMETLPEGLKHVQSLRSLWISACPALKSLPEWIRSLTVLQHLRIESCHSLTKLPDGIKEVKSLMKFELAECPELRERCREHTGEDWHKIKHARVLLHKSWRYGLMSELEDSQNVSNVRAINDVKYFIIPVIAAVQRP